MDCFVALWLTLPRGKPFWKKWSTAWRIKGGHAYRLNFDLHRAGGLWLWLLLLPVAVSSVAMNLPSQVFKPAVSLFSSIEPSVYEARGRMPADELGATQLSYQQAYDRALEEGTRLGLTVPMVSCITALNTTSTVPDSGSMTPKRMANPGCFSMVRTADC